MHILALDFGTSGLKAAVGDTAVTILYPTHGVYQDPQDWLEAFRQVTARLRFDAVALTGQMQDLVTEDRARLYFDTTAANAASRLRSAVPHWDEITANEQGATSNAAMFLDSPAPGPLWFGPAGYVAARLGLGHVVDSTTASTTGLMNFTARTWSQEILAAAGIEASQMPEIRDGLLGSAGKNDLGVPPGTPVILAPGDAGATSLGMGSEYVYLGTSGWYAAVLPQRPPWPGAFHTLALGSRVLSIAAVLSAAGTADWWRERLRLPIDAAEGRTRGWTGILATPSLRGERFPVRDDNATVSIRGIHAGHSREDIYAGVLEGVALALSVAIPQGDVLPVTGGGANSRAWLEILADVTGRPVCRSTGDGLLGAAKVARRALGLDAEKPATGPIIEPVADYSEARAAYA